MSKWLMFFLIYISLPLRVVASSQPPVDIVFDIDWTTFYSVEESQKDEKTLLVQERLYRATDHLTEVIEALLKNHPEVRISFFSGGENSRNETLLKNTRLPNGKSLWEVSYKVFSKEHLTEVSADEGLSFPQRFKKNISTLIPDAHPTRTVLIDDQVAFAQSPLKAVDSLGHFNFTRQFLPTKATEKYFPPSRHEWQQERQKALIWYSLIVDALEESQKGTKNFSDLLALKWQNSALSVETLKKAESRTCSRILLN